MRKAMKKFWAVAFMATFGMFGRSDASNFWAFNNFNGVNNTLTHHILPAAEGELILPKGICGPNCKLEQIKAISSDNRTADVIVSAPGHILLIEKAPIHYLSYRVLHSNFEDRQSLVMHQGYIVFYDGNGREKLALSLGERGKFFEACEHHTEKITQDGRNYMNTYIELNQD